MGSGEAEGEDRAIQAAEKAIANPLLDEISLRGAKGVLINITGSHDLTLFELDEAANRIREEVDPEANIIVGSTLDTGMDGTMRVSVVATGIDATDVQTDIPVPRRSLRQPLTAPQLTEELAAAEEETIAPETPAVAATVTEDEPSLFPGLEAEQTVAADLGQDIFDEPHQDDGLPPPAYQPVAEAPVEPDFPLTEDETAASFVAPRAPAPGTPSPEALERLRAAAQRTTSVPAPAPAPEAAETPAEKRGFGINSLINRMTGHATDTPAAPARQQPVVRQAPPQAGAAAQPEEAADPDQDRIEIPAFLRRQAN